MTKRDKEAYKLNRKTCEECGIVRCVGCSCDDGEMIEEHDKEYQCFMEATEKLEREVLNEHRTNQSCA